MEFILLAVVVYQAFRISSLSGRIDAIERGAPRPAPQQPAEAYAAQPVNKPAPQLQVVPQGDTAVDRFFDWAKEDWLMKLGALLLLIGFGWLTTYAFMHNWVGPVGRITLGILAGAGLLWFGSLRMRTFEHQGGIFMVVGSTTILLTVFAARSIYGFFTPLSALALMFLSAAYVAYVSVAYRNKALALASIILAGFAPLLTDSAPADEVWLFGYLLAVILGTIWIVALTGARELTAAALVTTLLYSLPHLASGAENDTLLFFEFVFAAVFFVANIFGILKRKDGDSMADLVVAAGNGLLLLAWIGVAVQDEWQSLVIAAWMAVFTLGAHMVYRTTGRREPFYVYAAIGIVFLAAATAAELDGALLTIAYILESGLVSLLILNLTGDLKAAERSVLLMVGPALLAFGSMSSFKWQTGVFHDDFFALLLLSLTLFAMGFAFKGWKDSAGGTHDSGMHAGLIVAGSVYAYILVWLALKASLQNDDTAVMIALVIYTLIGISTYFDGKSSGDSVRRSYGGILLGFVVARLLFIDVWNMVLAGRIATFFLIGALLMGTAFLSRRGKVGEGTDQQ